MKRPRFTELFLYWSFKLRTSEILNGTSVEHTLHITRQTRHRIHLRIWQAMNVNQQGTAIVVCKCLSSARCTACSNDTVSDMLSPEEIKWLGCFGVPKDVSFQHSSMPFCMQSLRLDYWLVNPIEVSCEVPFPSRQPVKRNQKPKRPSCTDGRLM